MFVPETPVMVNTVELVALGITALLSVQLPLVPVTQLAEPPGEKLPLTVAPAMASLPATLRIPTVAWPR